MIANQVVTVTTGATPLISGGGALNDKRFIVLQPTTASNIWVGGASVTTDSGIVLASSTVPWTIELGFSENLFAISTITNATVRVMGTRAGAATVV